MTALEIFIQNRPRSRVGACVRTAWGFVVRDPARLGYRALREGIGVASLVPDGPVVGLHEPDRHGNVPIDLPADTHALFTSLAGSGFRPRVAVCRRIGVPESRDGSHQQILLIRNHANVTLQGMTI